MLEEGPCDLSKQDRIFYSNLVFLILNSCCLFNFTLSVFLKNFL